MVGSKGVVTESFLTVGLKDNAVSGPGDVETRGISVKVVNKPRRLQGGGRPSGYFAPFNNSS
jgi:hypothetical protein